MPSFSFLKPKFFGSAASTAAGFAAGRATAPTLAPILQSVANEAWTLHPDVPPDAYAMAEGVAQGQVAPKQAAVWAKQQGIGDAQFAALVNVASGGPALGLAFEAWRRGNLTDDEFSTALKRTGLEPQWFDALKGLKARLLDPADLARGIHKSLIPDPGLLASPQPKGVGKVPAYPVYPIDALEQAAGFGYSKDELGVLVGLQGNPMGAHEAAEAVFRGVIEPADYDRAIAEGNTRNEWGDAIFEQSKQIPTARDFLENALRGYSSLEEAIAGAAKHGMSAADATLIYQNQGRPMTVKQITQALARGAKFNPEPGEIHDPYMASIVEGSLKPAYYELEAALKYTYPSAFTLRSLTSSGDISPADAEKILLYEGWEPGFAKQVSEAWAPSGAGKPNPWVARAQGYLFTAIHKNFSATPEYEAKARAALSLIGIKQTDQDAILALYVAEDTLT